MKIFWVHLNAESWKTCFVRHGIQLNSICIKRTFEFNLKWSGKFLAFSKQSLFPQSREFVSLPRQQSSLVNWAIKSLMRKQLTLIILNSSSSSRFLTHFKRNDVSISREAQKKIIFLSFSVFPLRGNCLISHQLVARYLGRGEARTRNAIHEYSYADVRFPSVWWILILTFRSLGSEKHTNYLLSQYVGCSLMSSAINHCWLI